jgi:phosphate-selective porin
MRSLSKTAAASSLLFFISSSLLAAQDQAAPSVTSSRAFKLSGYTQVLYTAPRDGVDGLAIRRSRFTLTGDLLKNVRFKATVDLVKSPILIDAQVDFILHEAASIRVGQFKVPFSLEMTTSSGELDLVNRSQPVNKLSPSLDINGGGRDIGAVVFGKAAFLEYTLGLFNGAGANKADTNDAKDLAGRLIVHPLSFLSLGASFYDGSYAASPGSASFVRDRVGVDLALIHGPVSLKADFIQAEDGDTLRRGWYVQGGYAFLSKVLQSVVRFDSFDPDGAVSGDRLDTWTVGLNWFLAERTKVQVNYELMKNQAGGTAGRTLLIQLQAGY